MKQDAENQVKPCQTYFNRPTPQAHISQEHARRTKWQPQTESAIQTWHHLQRQRSHDVAQLTIQKAVHLLQRVERPLAACALSMLRRHRGHGRELTLWSSLRPKLQSLFAGLLAPCWLATLYKLYGNTYFVPKRSWKILTCWTLLISCRPGNSCKSTMPRAAAARMQFTQTCSALRIKKARSAVFKNADETQTQTTDAACWFYMAFACVDWVGEAPLCGTTCLSTAHSHWSWLREQMRASGLKPTCLPILHLVTSFDPCRPLPKRCSAEKMSLDAS